MLPKKKWLVSDLLNLEFFLLYNYWNFFMISIFSAFIVRF
jgi:hypothetical protein